MPDSQLSPIIIASAALILAMSPESFAASLGFAASLILHGFIRWNQAKESAHSESLENQVKELKTKVDNIILGKSLGR